MIINGKRVDLKNSEVIFADGRFHGDRGVTLYRTRLGNYVWKAWSRYQGEDDEYTLCTKEEAIEKLQNYGRHPERISVALDKLGFEAEEF